MLFICLALLYFLSSPILPLFFNLINVCCLFYNFPLLLVWKLYMIFHVHEHVHLSRTWISFIFFHWLSMIFYHAYLRKLSIKLIYILTFLPNNYKGLRTQNLITLLQGHVIKLLFYTEKDFLYLIRFKNFYPHDFLEFHLVNICWGKSLNSEHIFIAPSNSKDTPRRLLNSRKTIIFSQYLLLWYNKYYYNKYIIPIFSILQWCLQEISAVSLWLSFLCWWFASSVWLLFRSCLCLSVLRFITICLCINFFFILIVKHCACSISEFLSLIISGYS